MSYAEKWLGIVPKIVLKNYNLIAQFLFQYPGVQMNQYRILILLIALLFFSGSPFSFANESDDASTRLELDLISLYNPLGISISAEGFHQRIYRRDAAPLWNGLYYQAGVQANVNPAYSRVGVHLEWMPVAILQLRAQYDRLYFSGSNGSLLSFSSRDALFGDDEIKAREGEEVAATGSRSLFNLTLRARFGRTIIRNVIDFAYYEFPGQGPFYLEREYELLMSSRDHVLSNQLYLLFEFGAGKGKTVFFGPYHDYVHVTTSDLTRERVGLTWFQEYDSAFGALQKPRWYLQSGVYLTDRNRQDEFYLIFGVGGDFDF